MSDIRELLRTTHVCEDMAGAALALIHEQDAEIVRLRAENERLRAALSRIMAGHSTTTEMRAEAAEALGPWKVQP